MQRGHRRSGHTTQSHACRERGTQGTACFTRVRRWDCHGERRVWQAPDFRRAVIWSVGDREGRPRCGQQHGTRADVLLRCGGRFAIVHFLTVFIPRASNRTRTLPSTARQSRGTRHPDKYAAPGKAKRTPGHRWHRTNGPRRHLPLCPGCPRAVPSGPLLDLRLSLVTPEEQRPSHGVPARSATPTQPGC